MNIIEISLSLVADIIKGMLLALLGFLFSCGTMGLSDLI